MRTALTEKRVREIALIEAAAAIAAYDSQFHERLDPPPFELPFPLREAVLAFESVAGLLIGALRR